MKSVFLTFIMILMLKLEGAELNEFAYPGFCLPVYVENFLRCYETKQQDQHLSLVKIGGEGECGITKLSLLFNYNKHLNIPSARTLIVQLVKSLIQEMSEDKRLQPYFASFPPTEDQLIIRIQVTPPHCGFVYPKIGNITYISSMDETINYGTINSFTYEIDVLRIETFQQASLLRN